MKSVILGNMRRKKSPADSFTLHSPTTPSPSLPLTQHVGLLRWVGGSSHFHHPRGGSV